MLESRCQSQWRWEGVGMERTTWRASLATWGVEERALHCGRRALRNWNAMHLDRHGMILDAIVNKAFDVVVVRKS